MANEPKDIAIYKGDNIRDKKLADATSADTVDSGDSVVLKTTSGDYVEIDRDSFADEIRKVMGGLIGNNDKGTSISGITVTDANNDLGSVTPSNLASILGDKFQNIRIQTLPHNSSPTVFTTWLGDSSWNGFAFCTLSDLKSALGI